MYPGTEECNDCSLNLSSKESTPQADKIKADEIGKRENKVDKGKGKKESKNDAEGPMSQYEAERERNIARNKEALKKLDEDFREKYGDVGFELDKTITKTSRRKKEKAHLEGQHRVSARLSVVEQR